MESSFIYSRPTQRNTFSKKSLCLPNLISKNLQRRVHINAKRNMTMALGNNVIREKMSLVHIQKKKQYNTPVFSDDFKIYKRMLFERGIINEVLAPVSEETATTMLERMRISADTAYDKHNARFSQSANIVDKYNDEYMALIQQNEYKTDPMFDVEEEVVVDPKEALMEARNAKLDPHETDVLKAILRGSPTSEKVVINKFSVDMTHSKMMCLKPSTWLNDEIINFYMNMLQERDAKLTTAAGGESTQKLSHYFSSFFIDRLTADGQYNYKNVQRWTRNKDMFAKDKIFMPINIGQTHWTLAVVYVQRKEIHYYDSMSGRGTRYLPHILHWLEDEAKDKKKTPIIASEWKLIDQEKHVPQQRNGVDCGVFTTVCADYLSDDLPLGYSQEDMNDWRVRIGTAIIRGEISY